MVVLLAVKSVEAGPVLSFALSQPSGFRRATPPAVPGDGWSGNELTIASCFDSASVVGGPYTIDSGYTGTFSVCLPSELTGGIEVTVGGGTWTSEIEWTIGLPSGGTTQGVGDGIWRDTCPAPLPTVSPAPTTACETYTVTMVDSYGDGASDAADSRRGC